MTTLAQPLARSASATKALLALLLWSVAAILVTEVHVHIERASVLAAATATILILLGAAYCYTTLAARESGATHALAVGVAWLVLSIVAELVAGVSLLGSPSRPVLSNLYLIVWIFAPVVFARRGAGD